VPVALELLGQEITVGHCHILLFASVIALTNENRPM
jgi:hypothetical protein